jgi:hypothetical protein
MLWSIGLRNVVNDIFAMVLATTFLLAPDPAWAQSKPLKAGTYHCTTISSSTFSQRATDANDPSEINRRAGGNKIRPMAPPQLFFGPAAFGNVMLDGKGNYRMPSVRQTGRYGFNTTTGRPTFTGDLGAMKQGYYSGTGTSFTVSIGDGMNFQCSLTGASTGGGASTRQNEPASAPFVSMGPALKSVSATNFTGNFTGDYVCANSPSTLQFSLSADPDGKLVGIFRFGGDRMAEMNYAVGAYSLKGRWQGSHFELKGDAWIRQPDGYVMVDFEGEISDRGVFGKVVHPACSTFTATKVQ